MRIVKFMQDVKERNQPNNDLMTDTGQLFRAYTRMPVLHGCLGCIDQRFSTDLTGLRRKGSRFTVINSPRFEAITEKPKGTFFHKSGISLSSIRKSHPTTETDQDKSGDLGHPQSSRDYFLQ